MPLYFYDMVLKVDSAPLNPILSNDQPYNERDSSRNSLNRKYPPPLRAKNSRKRATCFSLQIM